MPRSVRLRLWPGMSPGARGAPEPGVAAGAELRAAPSQVSGVRTRLAPAARWATRSASECAEHSPLTRCNASAVACRPARAQTSDIDSVGSAMLPNRSHRPRRRAIAPPCWAAATCPRRQRCPPTCACAWPPPTVCARPVAPLRCRHPPPLPAPHRHASARGSVAVTTHMAGYGFRSAHGRHEAAACASTLQLPCNPRSGARMRRHGLRCNLSRSKVRG